MGTELTDLFGNPVVIKPKPGPFGRGRVKMIDRLHAAFGIKDDQRCKNCVHFVRVKYANIYFKCGLTQMTASTASDIKANDIACGKFEAEL